jgi:hypothetical protein
MFHTWDVTEMEMLTREEGKKKACRQIELMFAFHFSVSVAFTSLVASPLLSPLMFCFPNQASSSIIASPDTFDLFLVVHIVINYNSKRKKALVTCVVFRITMRTY